jgi:hypothetical protein
MTKWSYTSPYSRVLTGGPPFALELVMKHLEKKSATELAAYDLSRVHSVILGAEPIQGTTLLAWADATKPLGFSANAFIPAYGKSYIILWLSM